jgi:hypothetical protein
VSYFRTDSVVIHLTLSERAALADRLEVAHAICLNSIYGKGEKTQNKKAYSMPMLKELDLRRPSKSTLGA